MRVVKELSPIFMRPRTGYIENLCTVVPVYQTRPSLAAAQDHVKSSLYGCKEYQFLEA